MDNSGRVQTWGDEKTGGELPDSFDNGNIKMIYSNRLAFVALDNSGRVQVWGYDNYGGKLPDSFDNGNIKMISQGNDCKRGHYIYHPEYDKLYYNDEYSNLYNIPLAEID